MKIRKYIKKFEDKISEFNTFDVNNIYSLELEKLEKQFKNFIKTTNKIAFDDEIKYELQRYLQNTIWSKVGSIEERINKLMELHSKFINNVRNRMSADEIAKKLFEYEKNTLSQK